MRKLMITGNLVADAELKQAVTGRQFVTFRIGNNEYFDKTDNNQPKAFWTRVVLFNNLSMVNHLKKGKYVSIIGNYTQSVYASKVSGQCEISNDIVADSVEFPNIGIKPETNANHTDNTASPSTQTAVVNNTPKPTTAEVASSIPTPITAQTLENNDDDDLPF